MTDVLAEDGERLPERIRLEGKDDLDAGLFGHATDEFEIAAQQSLLEDVTGRWESLVIGRTNIGFQLYENILDRTDGVAAIAVRTPTVGKRLASMTEGLPTA